MIRPACASAPAAQLAQEEVRVAARVGDVAQDGRAARLAGVVYDEVAEAQEALEDGRADGYVLDVAQRDVARRPRDEALVNLYLRVGERVAHGVALEVLVGRDEQERQRERQRDVEVDANPRLPREQRDQCEAAERGQRVAELDEEERRADCEDDLLRAAAFYGAALRCRRERADGERLNRSRARRGDARLFGRDPRRLRREARLLGVSGRATRGAEARRGRQTRAAVVAVVHRLLRSLSDGLHSSSPSSRSASSSSTGS